MLASKNPTKKVGLFVVTKKDRAQRVCNLER